MYSKKAIQWLFRINAFILSHTQIFLYRRLTDRTRWIDNIAEIERSHEQSYTMMVSSWGNISLIQGRKREWSTIVSFWWNLLQALLSMIHPLPTRLISSHAHLDFEPCSIVQTAWPHCSIDISFYLSVIIYSTVYIYIISIRNLRQRRPQWTII